MSKKKEKIFLNELKRRSLKVGIFFLVVLICASIFVENIFSLIIKGLNPPKGVSLIISSPSNSALILLSIIFFTALAISLPFFIYQLIMYVKPALTKREKSLFLLFLGVFAFLFALGIIFGFFITKSVLMPFLAKLVVNTSVLNMWDISEFINFFLIICFGMGLTFQMPLIISFLVKMQIIEISTLSKFRKHIFVLILIAVAFLTPNGDPFSLIIVSLPLFLLFEVSILIAKLIKKKYSLHE
jgi:sec-independent protein translocase protein TatC